MNERIAIVRKNAGLTQEQFAAKIGLSRNFIWMIEKGDRVPSDRTISDICRKFGVCEAWLRDGIDPMYTEIDKDVEFSKIWAEIGEADNTMLKEAVKLYWNLPEDAKEMVRNLMASLIAGTNKKNSPGE